MQFLRVRNPEAAQFSSVQSLSRVQLFATPRIAARQSITNSRSSLKLTSIELVMPSNHLILCHPLLLPPIPPSIRVFSNESTLHEVAKVLEFQLQHHSFQRNPRADLQNGLVGSSCSPRVIHVETVAFLYCPQGNSPRPTPCVSDGASLPPL